MGWYWDKHGNYRKRKVVKRTAATLLKACRVISIKKLPSDGYGKTYEVRMPGKVVHADAYSGNSWRFSKARGLGPAKLNAYERMCLSQALKKKFYRPRRAKYF